MLTTASVLRVLGEKRSGEVVVTTMATVRPWGMISDSPLDFASADSAMGHAADFALGIALAQPERRVVCLNGDGSMLMTLGTLATAVQSGASNLVLFVMENRSYEITGNQKIPAAGTLDFPMIAKAVGFPHAFECNTDARLESTIDLALSARGPVLASFAVAQGNQGPISRSPREEARYLKISLAESARRLREHLL